MARQAQRHGASAQAFYLRLVQQITPESIATALAALTSGDIRAMLVNDDELGDVLGIPRTAARSWCRRQGVPQIRLGPRVYFSKLDIIMALHGHDLQRLAKAGEAVGLPPWVLGKQGSETDG